MKKLQKNYSIQAKSSILYKKWKLGLCQKENNTSCPYYYGFFIPELEKCYDCDKKET